MWSATRSSTAASTAWAPRRAGSNDESSGPLPSQIIADSGTTAASKTAPLAAIQKRNSSQAMSTPASAPPMPKASSHVPGAVPPPAPALTCVAAATAPRPPMISPHNITPILASRLPKNSSTSPSTSAAASTPVQPIGRPSTSSAKVRAAGAVASV